MEYKGLYKFNTVNAGTSIVVFSILPLKVTFLPPKSIFDLVLVVMSQHPAPYNIPTDTIPSN